MLKIILCAGLIFSCAINICAQHTDGLVKSEDYYNTPYDDLDERSAVKINNVSSSLLKTLALFGDKTITFSTRNTSRKKGVLIGTKAGKEIFRAGYKRNHLQGVWISAFDNGLMRDSGGFHHNVPDGEWLSWYENGSIRSVRNYSSAKWFAVQREVKNRNSKIFYYHLSGSVGFNNRNFESLTKADASFSSLPSVPGEDYAPPFKYCLHHGLFMNYYSNGAVKDSGYYKDGLRDGLWNEFHSNGLLSASGSYFKGLKNSGWKYFNKQGKLTMLAEFRNGKLLYRKTYSAF
jgi:antitoxin component YwqK of YwqJK toxin-antitoxin module